MNPGTLTLLAYVIFLVPMMLAGAYFARRRQFTIHKGIMTTIVIANWVLIAVVMVGSYGGLVTSNPPPTGIALWLPTAHLVVGGIAQLLATYLVVMMWTENTPVSFLAPYRFQNLKPPMRTALGLWLLAVLFGVGIYYTWYLAPASGTIDAEAGAPVATEEALLSPDAPDATENADATVEATENEIAPSSTEDTDDSAADEDAPAPAATEEADS